MANITILQFYNNFISNHFLIFYFFASKEFNIKGFEATTLLFSRNKG